MTANLKPEQYYLGYDIGGTKCSIVLGDKNFKIHEKIGFPTRTERGYEKILEEFRSHSDTLLSNYGLERLAGIGISCGGPLNSAEGVIYSPPNLPGWDAVPIVDILSQWYAVKVEVQNDANACALAEWMMGAGKGTRNMIFLTMGTGMGAGLILDGRLYSGTNDLGGEVGHMRLAEDGPVGFGKAGSFEGFTSGGGIARLAGSIIRKKLKDGEPVGFCPTPEQIEDLSAKKVFEADAGGDPVAGEIVDITARYLGRGLAILVDVLNPECIVIGSIYARNEARLKPLVEEVLQQEAIPAANAVCRIVPAALGEQLGDFAALSVALKGKQ